MTTSKQLAQSLLESVPPHLIPALEKEFRTGWHREEVAGVIHQKRIARENKQTDYRSLEGMGRLRLRVDPTVFHAWGQRLGYDCWKDNGFLKDFERDNPEVRVDCKGTKISSGYSGAKFRKTYQ